MTTAPRTHDVPLEQRTIGYQLARRLEDSADRCFIAINDKAYTFGKTDAIARSFARGLHGLGIKAGDHVMLMLPNCAEFVFAWFGTALLRAITIPIDPRLTGQLLEYMLSDAAPRYLVITSELLPALATVQAQFLQCVERVIVVESIAGHGTKWPELAIPVIRWDDLLVHHGADPETPADFSDISMVMYTSGSTGPAKGVVMSNAHRFTSGLAMMRAVDLRNSDVLFTPFPLFHGLASGIGVLPALVQGVPIVIGEKFSASGYWEQASRCGATVGLIPPTIPSLLMAQPAGKFDRDHQMRVMFNSRSEAAFEQRFGVELIESYGMTEISHIISASYSERRPGCAGRAQPGWEIRLLEEDGTEVATGEAGEIVARPSSPSLMMAGYLNKPEETAKLIRDGWFHTGDYGYFDAEGYFHFAGRKAERIRRLGENISPLQIETEVLAHEAVGECAALPHPAPTGEDDIRLVVVLKAGATLHAPALIDFLQGRLPRFMLPRYIEFFESIPRTESGKVSKRTLLKQALSANAWDGGARSGRGGRSGHSEMQHATLSSAQK